MKKTYTFLFLLLIFLLFASCSNKSKKTDTEVNIYTASDITLSVKENSITKQGLTLLVENNTGNDYSYDVIFKLESKRNDSWIELNSEQVFSANVWIVSANSTDEFPITWEDELKKSGAYRILKPINTPDGVQYLCVEFEI